MQRRSVAWHRKRSPCDGARVIFQATVLPNYLANSMRGPQDVNLYDAIRQRYQVLVPLTARLPLRLRT